MKQDEIINQQLSSSQVASESSNYSELRADIQKLGQIVSTVARKTASTYNEFTENKKSPKHKKIYLSKLVEAGTITADVKTDVKGNFIKFIVDKLN